MLRHSIDRDIMCEFFVFVEKNYFSSMPFSDVTNSFSVKMNGWLGTIHQSLNKVDSVLITVARVVSKLCECKFYHEPNDDSVSQIPSIISFLLLCS